MSVRKLLFCSAVILGMAGCVANPPGASGGAGATQAGAAEGVPPPGPSEASQRLYLDLISRLIGQGSYDAALAHLEEYRLRVPNDPNADLMRADVLSRLGRDTEALDILVPYVLGDDKGPLNAKGYKIAGRIYAGKKRWDRAVKYFEKARAAAPSDPSTLNNLGYALAQDGDFKRSIQMLRQAYDLAPQADQIRNNLIISYYYGGKRKTAKSMFDDLEHIEKKAVSAMIKAWPEQPKL